MVYEEPDYVVPGEVYAAPGAAYAPRYGRYNHGYDTNYVGPWKERQLQGSD